MKLSDFIEKLNKIKEEIGGDTEVLVDTEARKFNAHLIPVKDVFNLGVDAVEAMDAENDICIIHVF